MARILAQAVGNRRHGLEDSRHAGRARHVEIAADVIARLEQHMSRCDICGQDPCELPTFCNAAREHEKARPKKTVEAPKSWRDGLITAKDLQTKTFPPVRIILPDLIPEGITLLAGKPKIGKSLFALDVCLAVADEVRFVLGDKQPVHGDALYLALEDNERRLKKRIDKVLQNAKAPKRLQFHTE